MTSLLQTHDLTIGYSPVRRPAIKVAEGLNLTLNMGEFVCLIGPNGAGKSTLLHTLAGMQPPLSGKVRLSGDDLHRLEPLQLAKRLSVVLTERPNVGSMTGYALVALGRHPYTDWMGKLTTYDEAVVQWAIEAVGAADLAAHPLVELSDGQRQKLMIARALAQDTALMLLDEPTAFLDLPRRVEIMRLLKRLAHETNKGILLSTHDLELALRTADTIWLMSSRGELHVGTPEALIVNGAFEQVFAEEGIEGVEFDAESKSFRIKL